MSDTNKISTADALRMPAEWEPHKAVWLAWPYNRDDWPDRFGPIPWVYVEFIRVLARRTPVRVLVQNEKQHKQAEKYLERAHVDGHKITFLPVPTDRVWTRDSGPTFVYRGNERVLLDWHFNAWAKYDNWHRDNKIPRRLAQHLDLERLKPTHKVQGDKRHVVVEGGAVDVNGRGTLLTTEECLLSDVQCRNPGFTRKDYETVFRKFLGVRHVVWLENGIAGDDTHGHVDDLARFVGPSTIVLAAEVDPNDANYAPLRENRKRLEAARDQDGNPFTVVDLPLPRPIHFEGQRLPASYANFLISNGQVLVPTFNDPNDRVALSTLAEILPQHEITPVYCGDLVWGLGTLHCASQQEIAIQSLAQENP